LSFGRYESTHADFRRTTGHAVLEVRKRRAECVHAAVDGRNVKSGAETTIPIPRSDSGVEELLDRLVADRREVEATDIEALEAETDDAVYDLFGLDAEEREVIEEYLEVF
jgi:hypothetical protein